MEQEKIYEMKLHEKIIIDNIDDTYVGILRVAGGWIYFVNTQKKHSATFVPISEEFYKSEPLKPAQPSKNYEK